MDEFFWFQSDPWLFKAHKHRGRAPEQLISCVLLKLTRGVAFLKTGCPC